MTDATTTAVPPSASGNKFSSADALIAELDAEYGRAAERLGEEVPGREENVAFLRETFAKAEAENPKPADKPADENADAPAKSPGDDLDSLLRQYKDGIRPRNRVDDAVDDLLSGEQPDPLPNADKLETAEQIQQRRADLGAMQRLNRFSLKHYQRATAEKFAARDAADLTDLVGFVQERAGLSELSTADVEAHVHRIAHADAVVREAWASRYDDSAQWERALGRIVSDVSTAAEPTVRRLRDSQPSDLIRAAASVRNVTTEPSRAQQQDPQKIFKMSDQEYARFKESQGL